MYVKFNECTNKETEEGIEIAGIETSGVDDEGSNQMIIELRDMPK
jgi:hypothetical protein